MLATIYVDSGEVFYGDGIDDDIKYSMSNCACAMSLRAA